MLSLIGFFGGLRRDMHKSGCVWFVAMGLTMLLTNCIKLYEGCLRPIFYNICQPDEDYENCTTESERDIRVSFPSGHSSYSFCGLLLFSFYLERTFGATRRRSFKIDQFGRVPRGGR